ncbi:MAG TPA: asparagine synthase (glutamine-hydrolyzing) [Flavisolibacter sp.]|nr:asparagine synthase (glutamine-hydrolyzing) [Flavisolibacter sp.]
MCGIAGIISASKGQATVQRISASTACLRHRGPDSEGAWADEHSMVALGHTRLGIIDLSSAALQPLHYRGRYTIIHNGELYNYQELRASLISLGAVFRSQSDTEVIVAAYAAWGIKCLESFDGMFAFAIWDKQEGQLFAARDRFGEKPFFYHYDGTGLLFGSEIKTLWSLGAEKQVNSAMLYNYLTIGYTSNPGDQEETFYQGISRLPAASYLLYTPLQQKLETGRYWQLYPEEDRNISDSEAIAQFRALFGTSIERRLRSDVAIGTSLSGGLDSSAIVAMCAKATSDSYSHKCFTASFENFEKDETAAAASVAAQYGLQHHLVRIPEDELVPLMGRVMKHQEEPFGSASVLAQYKVYEAARKEGVKVLLDGQGADEVLAGYRHYYSWYWQELYRSRKLSSSGELSLARKLGVDTAFGTSQKMAAVLPELAAGLHQSRKAKKAASHTDLDPDFRFLNKRNLYYSLPSSFSLNGALYFSTFVHGLEELLRLADRNSMAHGVEVRLPYLSHELVSFLFTLPARFKIREGHSKWLLRKAVEDMLPLSLVWQSNKIGFEPPQQRWMESPAVREAILEGKKKLAENGVLDKAAVKKIKPHSSYAAQNGDWRYWSASYLFGD